MAGYKLASTTLLIPTLLAIATYVHSETPAQQPSSAPAPAPADALAEQKSIPPTIQYERHNSAGGLTPAGGSLTNPHKGEKATAEAGASLFSSMNCDGCHGGGATGWAAPSLADGRWRYGGDEDELFQSIYYGRPKGMPAYGGMLGTNGVWVLVTYLQSLPVPANVPTQSWETP